MDCLSARECCLLRRRLWVVYTTQLKISSVHTAAFLSMKSTKSDFDSAAWGRTVLVFGVYTMLFLSGLNQQARGAWTTSFSDIWSTSLLWFFVFLQCCSVGNSPITPCSSFPLPVLHNAPVCLPSMCDLVSGGSRWPPSTSLKGWFSAACCNRQPHPHLT